MEEQAGELDHLINQEVNFQTVGPDGVSPDEELTDDGGLDSPEHLNQTDSRTGRSRERQFVETPGKIIRRHSADAPINRRSSTYVCNQPSYLMPQFRGRSASPYDRRSSSVSRKATFIDGEYIPESSSLFRPTQARVSSMQAVYDRRAELEKLRSPPYVKVDPNYTPSDRLLRTTSARVLSQQAWAEHQRELELHKQVPTVKIDETYKPSERLMRKTKNYHAAIDAWEKEKEDRKFADDIWWEKRKTPDSQYKAKKLVVNSKLTEPTKAYLASKRPKAPVSEDANGTPIKESPRTPPPVPTVSAHLLKPTTATIQGTWKVAHEKELHPEEPPKPVLQLATKYSNIQAKSKLYEETSAAKSKKKIFDSPDSAQNQRSTSPPRVKEISAHLLRNPKARSRSPPVKKDPRETQWNSYASLSAAKSELNHATSTHSSAGNASSSFVSPMRRNSFDQSHPTPPPPHPFSVAHHNTSSYSMMTTTTTASSPAPAARLRPDTLHRLATPKHISSPPATPSRAATTTSSSSSSIISSARKGSGSNIPGPSPQKQPLQQVPSHNHANFAKSFANNSVFTFPETIDMTAKNASPATTAVISTVAAETVESF